MADLKKLNDVLNKAILRNSLKTLQGEFGEKSSNIVLDQLDDPEHKRGQIFDDNDPGSNANLKEIIRSLDQLQFRSLSTKDKKGRLDAKKKKTNTPLKIGDIIYLKFQSPIISNILKDRKNSQAIVIGDGIASNKIECVPQESQSSKNALVMFRKSLFKVENSKKYYHQIKLNEARDNKANLEIPDDFKKEMLPETEKKILKRAYFQKLERKVQEEQEENSTEYKKMEGLMIVYGQHIQLRHLYSNCLVTFNGESLARENGCFELSLEEKGSDLSNFKIMPTNNLRSLGDVCFYTDTVVIANCKHDQYYIHVAESVLNKLEDKNAFAKEFDKGLEVNGSEAMSNLKVESYISFNDINQNKLKSGKFLLSGDIVFIYNRRTNAYLCVTDRNINKYFAEKTITVAYGEEKISDFQTSFRMKLIDPPLIKNSDDYLEIYLKQDVNTTDSSKYLNFSTLWEIQPIQTFSGKIPKSDDQFRIKNVVTGLYLGATDFGDRKLILTKDAFDVKCYFSFKFKKNLEEFLFEIPYNETMKIQTNEITPCFFMSGDYKNDDKRIPIVSQKEKSEYSKFLFELIPAKHITKNTADRISSIFPYLMNFYMYLQTFGMNHDKGKQLEDSISYDYDRALNMEKDLENEIDQLNEAIENLEDFLNIVGEDDSILTSRQLILKDQKILDLLIYIAKLIDVMNFGSTYSKDTKIN